MRISSQAVLRSRRFEGNHLRSVVLRGSAQELDASGYHLDGVAPLAVLLPRPALQAPVDGHPSTLAQVLRAELRLPVPRRDPDEVRASVSRAPIDCEEEVRHLLF